jgi:hypothetical protein
MPPRIGYLLPTRESVMEGRPAAAPLLALAERAEGLGYDSIWVGDSILARPRHEPLTLLSAVAARTRRVELGTAVLLPALRNPVVLAHGIATLDQISEGRFILGVGIASDVLNIRSEFTACGVPFEKRVGRMLEGLRLARELWTGQPVNWNGRWVMENAVLGPTPHRPGGPPIWRGGLARELGRGGGRSPGIALCRRPPPPSRRGQPVARQDRLNCFGDLRAVLVRRNAAVLAHVKPGKPRGASPHSGARPGGAERVPPGLRRWSAPPHARGSR